MTQQLQPVQHQRQPQAPEQWEALTTTFIRNVQHELRTPVAVILGYAELLQRGHLGEIAPGQQNAVYSIRHQANVLRSMVERISTLVAVQSQMKLLQPLSLADLVNRGIRKLESQAEEKRIVLSKSLPDDLPTISGNPDHLVQALECLIENAIKFTTECGQVRIEAEHQEEWIKLSIIDNGIGIAQNQLNRIFETFYQIDGSSTRAFGGLGLGLALSKAVVENYGGTIEVDSKVGYGSEFILKFPVGVEQADALMEATQTASTHRILVVDDEEFVAMTLQEGLDKLPNCDVSMATSGEQALEFFEQNSFDLLITDYQMPDIDGITLANRVEELCPGIATIIITAYGETITHDRDTSTTIQRILDKPIKLADIRNITLETLTNTDPVLARI